jgi:flagellar hook-length control protein FliK
MDILATLVPAVPVQAAPATETPIVSSETFLAVLDQVTAAVAGPTPLPVVVPEVAVAPAPVEVPAPLVVPLQMPVQEPETPLADDVLNLLPDAPMAQVEDTEPTTKADTTLDDIRQRMALIESAGQLDTASVVVAPPIPVNIAVPVSVEASAPVVHTVQTPSVAVSDDDPDTTDEPVDPPDAMPALVATVAESVPAVHGHTQDSQPDSQPDAPTLFSLAPTAFTPTTVATPETVVTNGLVLAAAIGGTDWAADLGQQMVDMVTRGDQQVDLRLHPADLGPLSISLNLNDGTTQAQFQAGHASVRAAVEQALPQLREALATQGIALGQASVSDQSSRQAAGGQAQRDPQARLASASVSSSEPPAPVQQVLLRSSAVDLYV